MEFVLATALTVSMLTAPAADWITDCQYGTYRDRASNQLSAGRLETGLCSYSTSAVSQVNIRYRKDRGNAVVLRFAWEFVDKQGTRLTGTRHDVGKFRQTAGQTKYYSWKYPFPGTARPPAPLICGRGVLAGYDERTGALISRYETGVICW